MNERKLPNVCNLWTTKLLRRIISEYSKSKWVEGVAPWSRVCLAWVRFWVSSPALNSHTGSLTYNMLVPAGTRGVPSLFVFLWPWTCLNWLGVTCVFKWYLSWLMVWCLCPEGSGDWEWDHRNIAPCCWWKVVQALTGSKKCEQVRGTSKTSWCLVRSWSLWPGCL